MIKPCHSRCNASVHIEFLGNSGDSKQILRPRKPSENDICTVVTLGVGNDILAEQKLKKYQKCDYFGADPFENTGAAYRQVGKFFKVAVSDKSGKISASVLVESKPGKGDWGTLGHSQYNFRQYNSIRI